MMGHPAQKKEGTKKATDTTSLSLSSTLSLALSLMLWLSPSPRCRLRLGSVVSFLFPSTGTRRRQAPNGINSGDHWISKEHHVGRTDAPVPPDLGQPRPWAPRHPRQPRLRAPRHPSETNRGQPAATATGTLETWSFRSSSTPSPERSFSPLPTLWPPPSISGCQSIPI